MRDIDRFIELYKSVGIELEVYKYSEMYSDEYLDQDSFHEWKSGYFYFIQLDQDTEKYNDKFVGYAGFYSVVSFDADGNFISQGFWE